MGTISSKVAQVLSYPPHPLIRKKLRPTFVLPNVFDYRGITVVENILAKVLVRSASIAIEPTTSCSSRRPARRL